MPTITLCVVKRAWQFLIHFVEASEDRCYSSATHITPTFRIIWLGGRPVSVFSGVFVSNRGKCARGKFYERMGPFWRGKRDDVRRRWEGGRAQDPERWRGKNRDSQQNRRLFKLCLHVLNAFLCRILDIFVKRIPSGFPVGERDDIQISSATTVVCQKFN